MEIVRKLGGYSFGRADLVRRAMGKKKMDVMEKERQNFIYGQTDEEGNIIVKGAIRNGVDEKSASKIFDLMVEFANYAFNKSHSAAYAVIAYRTAWLKTYYPVEYMAALISSVMNNTSQVNLYIEECKRLGIEIKPPDINYSFGKFSVEGKAIRYGLSAVKNVGENIIDAIVTSRENGKFLSLNDFIERIYKKDKASINKRAVESLIKAGALNSLGGNRAQYLAIFEKIIEGISSDVKKNIEGQFSLFESKQISYDDELPKLAEFPTNILLQMEKEMLGIYVSGHPLQPYEREIKLLSNFQTTDIIEEHFETSIKNNIEDGKQVRIVGLITDKKNKVTKNNNMMAFFTLEDLYSTIECIVFPTVFEKYFNQIFEDNIVLVEGKLSISEVEDPKIIVDKISPVKKINFDKIYLRIDDIKKMDILEEVKSILSLYPGNVPVYIYFTSNKKTIMADRSLWIDGNSDEAIDKLKKLLGYENVKIIY
jgi:DNA polymerase-3 subunit alpha